MSPTRRMIVLALGVAALAALAFSLPLASVPAAVASLGVAAPVAGVMIGALLLVALVPRTPISLACGLLFGPAIGAVCAVALALIAAAVTFVAGRALGREFVARRAGRHWAKLERWIQRGGMLAVAAVRSIPLGPYGLSGYAYGASTVRVRDYAIGTTIAAIPSAVTYSLVGAAVAQPGALSPIVVAPLAISLVLSVAVVLRARRANTLDQPMRLGYGATRS